MPCSRVRRLPRSTSSRASWSYSNTGYTLLGRIVEKVSGKPFDRFLKERILDPLGMTHAAFEPGPDVKGRGEGYTSFALGPRSPRSSKPTAGWAPRGASGPPAPTSRAGTSP